MRKIGLRHTTLGLHVGISDKSGLVQMNRIKSYERIELLRNNFKLAFRSSCSAMLCCVTFNEGIMEVHVILFLKNVEDFLWEYP